MNNILFVTTCPSTIIAFLLPFAEYFRQKKWTVDAMANNIAESTCCDMFDHCWGINFTRNPWNIKCILKSVKEIKKIVLKQKYKIVHVHNPIAAFVVRYALRNLKNRPKIIYTAHGFHFHPDGNYILNTIFKFMEKTASQWTDALITINQHDFLVAKKMKLIPQQNIYYTPGIGIDYSYYNPGNIHDLQIKALRLELGLAPDDKILLMVAEFTPQKRHRLALEALYKLGDSTLHLVFAGRGRNLPAVQKHSIKLGLQNQVHFLGLRTDIPILMKASNILLLLSKREGLPRSILEAMALGLPVIGSNIRGIQDLLEEEAGLLVTSGCLPSLVNAINVLMNDVSVQKRLVMNAKNKLQHYDINHVLKLHSKIYEQVLTS